MPPTPTPLPMLNTPISGSLSGFPLHQAAREGSVSRTIAALSLGPRVGIDEGDTHGWTPLMYAALVGSSGVVRILLNRGANVSIAGEEGLTALIVSAMKGHEEVAMTLIKAGADLEARTHHGRTACHEAILGGHLAVMGALFEAGANVDSVCDGSTPLYIAAGCGNMDAVRMLLRAKADPLLASGPHFFLPLEIAAERGNSDVVGELLQQLGIGGCGGYTRGVTALCQAAQEQHVGIMAMLADAGVIDTGDALCAAVESGHEAPVKFLLQKQKGSRRLGTYVNFRNSFGATPLIRVLMNGASFSPRNMRLLVDAGADTTSSIQMIDPSSGFPVFNDTPMGLIHYRITAQGVPEKMHYQLKAMQRLLLQVEAVHAFSWSWARCSPPVCHMEAASASKTTNTKKATRAPLALVFPVPRRRASRRDVVVAAMSRYVRKGDHVQW